ncbi:thioesterase II family protein [Actinacidiphila glaucinigra]|uniref:thioesterase II family protein n=1 Tax=Actinacidiphila glaucinigra TaxID=235986 RepID=UPI0035DA05D9
MDGMAQKRLGGAAAAMNSTGRIQVNPQKTGASQTATSRWFRTIRSAPAPRLRLVCFPHAGGNAGFFRTWKDLVPEGVELLAAQYPARESRFLDAPAETMDELVADLADASRDLFDVPVAFFGHSMGASVAYELATRLREEHGRTPTALFVSGRGGPGKERRPGLADAGEEELIAELSEMGGTQAEVFLDVELRELVLPAIRADYRLLERYDARIPDADSLLDVPVVAYYGDGEADLDHESVMAWSAITRSGFHHRSFEGGHFYLVDEADSLVKDLLSRLPISN